MTMTHYMELLATDQPWNLLIFMAVPVILAETVAITELRLLYTRVYDGPVRTINRIAGTIGGFYFAGVFLYLLINAVIPLTSGGGWRGPADVLAVGFYLAGVVPLVGLAAIDLRLIAGRHAEHRRMALHAGFVALFLVVAHVAMIFGMLDPTLLTGAAGHGMAGHMAM
jgi:hypothetical protein